MNREVGELWVKALRSGEYEQGRGGLRQGDKFCCLGVLCDLAVKAGVAEARMTHDSDKSHLYGDAGDNYDASWSLLPRVVQEWAGVDGGNPRLGAHTAVAWNDEKAATFSEIADAIELELSKEAGS